MFAVELPTMGYQTKPFSIKKKFVVVTVLEGYYTSCDTVKAPSQAFFSIDVGSFFDFKKFAVLVTHVQKF